MQTNPILRNWRYNVTLFLIIPWASKKTTEILFVPFHRIVNRILQLFFPPFLFVDRVFIYFLNKSTLRRKIVSISFCIFINELRQPNTFFIFIFPILLETNASSKETFHRLEEASVDSDSSPSEICWNSIFFHSSQTQCIKNKHV